MFCYWFPRFVALFRDFWLRGDWMIWLLGFGWFVLLGCCCIVGFAFVACGLRVVWLLRLLLISGCLGSWVCLLGLFGFCSPW